MRKLWKASNWKYLIAFLVPILVALIMTRVLDNDAWGVLAEGRQIVKGGLYYTDELSMHEGLEITVQNYGFAVIFWLIYSVLGAPGLYVGMLIMMCVILWLIYKICMLISEKNVNLSLILTMGLGVLLAWGFIVTRAQLVDYTVLLTLIYVLELYVKTDKTKYLAWVPVLSLAEINLHASSWWMIFLIMLAYMVDAVKKPKWHLQGYRLGPLAGVFLVAIVMGLINPYGIKMITFIFTSYGGLANLDLVAELKPFRPLEGFNLIYYLAMVIVLWAYAMGKGKNMRVRYLLMLFGFLMLGLNTVKGLSELFIVMILPLALVYKDWKMPRLIDSVRIRWMIISWVGVVITGLTMVMLVTTVGQMKAEARESLVRAVDAIDAELSEGVDRGAQKVYTGYNDGGYLEFRGYPAYLDPRGEVFLKANNKKEDILQEWMDLRDGKIKIEDFLGKYEFDFLVVGKKDVLYNLENKRYEMIYDNEAGERGDRVYKKIDD